jgi:hypothetical protein
MTLAPSGLILICVDVFLKTINKNKMDGPVNDQ